MQVIKTYCDWCWHTGDQEVRADHLDYVVQLGQRGVSADLCDQHVKIVESGLETLFEVGRAPDRPAPIKSTRPGGKHKPLSVARDDEADNPFPCPVPSCYRRLESKQGLSMHLTRSHTVSERDVAEGVRIDRGILAE